MRILICTHLMVNVLLALLCFQIRLFQYRQNWNHQGTRAWKCMLNIRGSLQKIWRNNTKQWTHRFVLIHPAKILLRRHLRATPRTQRGLLQNKTNKFTKKQQINRSRTCIHGDITKRTTIYSSFRLCYINLQYKIQITSQSPSTLLQLFQTCHCIQNSIQNFLNNNNSYIWIVNKTTSICFIIKQIPTFQITTISWNNWLARCASSLATKMNDDLPYFQKSNIWGCSFLKFKIMILFFWAGRSTNKLEILALSCKLYV